MTPEQRAADLAATLREIIELSNQALRIRSMSGSTLRAAALQQIRDRAATAVNNQGEPDGNDGQ